MIRSFYGIVRNPFSQDQDIKLLEQQQEIYDILKVHSHQGGLCLLLGEPGSGKSIIKNSIKKNADKTCMVVIIGRTLHTYTNTIKILCQSFNIDHAGSNYKCEQRIIQEAYSLNNHGRSLIVIIDDAHLMDMLTLRKLRLMFEDFPKNHNLILVGQTELIHNLALKVNEDIKSRVTYSVILKKLNPDDLEKFLLAQLDEAGLPHNTFTENALALIIRSSDGNLRKTRNLALSCLIEAVRTRERSVDIANVNRVLIQPHWRIDRDIENLI